MAVKDPDDSVVAIFKEFAIKSEAKSAAAGRPVFDDMEIVELRYPGSRNWSAHPAAGFSHWGVDENNEQVKISYAERFRRQYQQFKSRSIQTKSGTPLDYAAFLTEARRAELRAQNIYTIETLAAIDGQPLKNLGQGGRDMKNAAMEYIDTTQKGAVNSQMQAEIEALRAKNMAMEQDLEALKAAKAAAPEGDEFEDMSLEQLRAYIETQTGQKPLGTLNRKNLLRLARDYSDKAVA
jgi:hypothetical protein